MARRTAQLKVELKVEYIQVPEDRLGDWHAGISQLLQLLYEERNIYETVVPNERMDIDCISHNHRSIPALLSLDEVTQG